MQEAVRLEPCIGPIASVRFEGNHVFSQRRLRNAMSKTKINTWWRFLSETSTTYSQANYDADVESIKGLYHSKGYKDVVVKDPVLNVFIKNPKAAPKKQKKNVRITIPLVEGDQFFIGQIQILKVDQTGQAEESASAAPLVVPREILMKEFRDLPPGAVLNRDYLIEALSKIEARYKSLGYIYWFADPAYRDVGKHRVDVDLKLFEGDKFYLGHLEVTGNTTTRDKVIRRELELQEQQRFSGSKLRRSQEKLRRLGFFEDVNITTRKAENEDDAYDAACPERGREVTGRRRKRDEDKG